MAYKGLTTIPAADGKQPSSLRKAWKRATCTCLVLSVPFMLAAAVYVVPAEYIPAERLGLKSDSIHAYKISVSDLLLSTQKSRNPQQ